VLDDRDIVVTMPEMGFAVTYRKDGNFPMLVATDILRDGLGPTRLNFLAQAWKAAYNKARALGWLRTEPARLVRQGELRGVLAKARREYPQDAEPNHHESKPT
jgi:hypothetical protein